MTYLTLPYFKSIFFTKLHFYSLLLLLLVGQTACKKKYDGKILLQQLGDNVIVPTYANFASRSAELEEFILQFCEQPNEQNLIYAQQAWRKTVAMWHQCKAFHIVNTDKIPSKAFDELDGQPVNEEEMNEMLNNQLKEINHIKSLPAIEYLIFDRRKGNRAVLKKFMLDRTVLHRGIVLKILASKVKKNAETVYSEQIVSNIADSTKALFHWFPTERKRANQDSIFRELVKQMIQFTGYISAHKIGRPLGDSISKISYPQLAENYKSANTLNNLRNNLTGLQKLFTGKNKIDNGLQVDLYQNENAYQGIYGYLIYIGDEELAEKIAKQFQNTILALEQIGQPLHEAIIYQPQAVKKLYAETKQLREQFEKLPIEGIKKAN